jgi:hypothetical protein
MAPTIELCPKCHRGKKVESTYTLNGVTYDDSYCGGVREKLAEADTRASEA